MSYLKVVEWELQPENSPQIIKNCSKCGCKSQFINTGNFRVNANGNCIDVWLIYHCHKCKTTYNLTIYERIQPSKLSRDEYEQYLSNDWELAMAWGFNSDLLRKNKAEVDFEDFSYQMLIKESENISTIEDALVIILRCPYQFRIRLNKVLAQQLGLSRTKVKQLIEDELIYGLKNEKLLKASVRDGMEIGIIDELFRRIINV